jgi:hypothetical protein
MKTKHSYAPAPVPTAPLAATRSQAARLATAIRSLATLATEYATGIKQAPSPTAYADAVALIATLKASDPQQFRACHEYDGRAVLHAYRII